MSEEIDWKSRAKLRSAELLNEEYRIQLLMADKISGEQRSRAEAAEAENQRLQAEVARLTGCLKTANSNHEHFEREWYLRGDRIAELEAEVARLKELCEAKDFADEAWEWTRKAAAWTATEAALRWAWGHYPFVSPYDKWMGDGLKALLGEEEK